MAPRASGSTEKSGPRPVNDILSTLRGEQFRRSQNAQGSRTHVSSSFVARNSPTLPIRTYSGPTPPKSWTKAKEQKDDTRATSSWRRDALSLLLEYRYSEGEVVPPLTTLCLRVMASYPSQEFVDDIVPWIPVHLRRELVRDAAIHAPLNSSKLYPLYGEDKHAAGEIIVVGPWGMLPEDYFLDPVIRTTEDEHTQEQLPDDWDADDSTPEPLATVALISIPLNTSTFLSLPPSLTKLALINVKSPVPLHRLPSICPLLTILDLSYNSWLSDEASSDAWLERVEWRVWADLRVLGFRECKVSEGMLQKVNKGRWDDVEIIQ